MINREDRLVPGAVARELASISRAVEVIAKSIQQGGRLIYVGAGTSGRLAALDAAECPPTFGVPSRLVQAVVAGGRRALTRAAEGKEDSATQGARDLAAKKIGAHDALCSGCPAIRAQTRRKYRAPDIKSEFTRSPLGTYHHRSADGSGGDCRFDTHEGRHSPETDSEHAQHCSHDPPRARLQ